MPCDVAGPSCCLRFHSATGTRSQKVCAEGQTRQVVIGAFRRHSVGNVYIAAPRTGNCLTCVPAGALPSPPARPMDGQRMLLTERGPAGLRIRKQSLRYKARQGGRPFLRVESAMPVGSPGLRQTLEYRAHSRLQNSKCLGVGRW